ncbi:MAG: transposase [Nitrosomonas sp.]|nr:transposase [Nitrosomonas sp.]
MRTRDSETNTNRQFLRKQKIKSAIMHRAYKNKPLSARQKLANQLISKKRYIVEQRFGTIKSLKCCKKGGNFPKKRKNFTFYPNDA